MCSTFRGKRLTRICSLSGSPGKCCGVGSAVSVSGVRCLLRPLGRHRTRVEGSARTFVAGLEGTWGSGNGLGEDWVREVRVCCV